MNIVKYYKMLSDGSCHVRRSRVTSRYTPGHQRVPHVRQEDEALLQQGYTRQKPPRGTPMIVEDIGNRIEKVKPWEAMTGIIDEAPFMPTTAAAPI